MDFDDIPDALRDAHDDGDRHREAVEASETCGCFHCLATYSPDEIQEWAYGDTAICPECGIDSVLPGSVDERYVEEAFLREMHEAWF
ncbi:MAG: cytoplasmic protein [Bradymonadaceae bacterium]